MVVKLIPDVFIEKIELVVVTVVVVELLGAFEGINGCCGRAPAVGFNLKPDALPNRLVCGLGWFSWVPVFPNNEVGCCWASFG